MASEKWSMTGYNLWTALTKNKDNLKVLVAFLVGFNYFSGFSWQSFLAGFLAVAGKLVIDALDYWQSE